MPEPEDHANNPVPGPVDGGGHGGMATREQDAREQDGADDAPDPERDPR